MVSEIFEPKRWREVEGFSFTDVTYHRAVDGGTVRVAFNRPEVRNAFRPHTVDELYRALDHARMSSDVGCVLLTGNGPSPKDGGWAFCSGGDQRIRGRPMRLKHQSSGEMQRAIDNELRFLLFDSNMRRDGSVKILVGDLLEMRLDMRPQGRADVEILACDLDQHRS